MRAMRPGLASSAIDAVAEVEGLVQIVGDEQHRRPPLGDDAQHLVLQGLARHGVERAKRLVHQQHRGVLRQAAGDLQPLLHAAGKLDRIFVGMVGKAGLGKQGGDALRRARPGGTPMASSARLTLPVAVRQGSSARP